MNRGIFRLPIVRLLLLLISLLIAVGCQPAASQNKSTEKTVPETEAEFRDKLAEFTIQRQKIKNRIQRVDRRKRETIEFLRSKGIQTSADIKDNDTDVKYALKNLKGWTDEKKRYEKEVEQYDEVIASIKAMLQKMERNLIREEVVISDEDLIELRTIVRSLNEDLEIAESDPLEDQELRDLFDSEVKVTDQPKKEK